MSYDNRKYVVFSVSELDSVDFGQVLETSKDTVRKSLDNSLTFVKYEGSMPSSISSLTTKSQEYTYSEFLTLLDGSTWTDPNPTETA